MLQPEQETCRPTEQETERPELSEEQM